MGWQLLLSIFTLWRGGALSVHLIKCSQSCVAKQNKQHESSASASLTALFAASRDFLLFIAFICGITLDYLTWNIWYLVYTIQHQGWELTLCNLTWYQSYVSAITAIVINHWYYLRDSKSCVLSLERYEQVKVLAVKILSLWWTSYTMWTVS